MIISRNSSAHNTAMFGIIKAMDKSVTLMVPVYRTATLAETLVRALPGFRAAAESAGWRFEGCIVVDDGSPNGDEIAEAVSRAKDDGVRLMRLGGNRGKGFAVKTGALAAKGAYVLMSDCDMSAPLEEFTKLAKAAERDPGAAMVCGSRRGLARGGGRPLSRRILSAVFAALAHCAGTGPVRDPQCGFKLFRMEAMRPMFEALRTERFAFDVELIRRARRAGLRVAEVPVRWHGGKRSTLHVISDGARMLFDLVRIAFMK